MKTREKLLSLLLSFGLILGMIPMTAFAENAAETWLDFAATDFAGGSGTKDDPYQIATAEQLAKLAKEVNSGAVSQNHSMEYFKLTNSIDLSGHRWVPIGYGNTTNTFGFYGYFDGNDQTITGLYVDERGNNVDAGLFGSVVAHSTETLLKNIYIENAEVYAGDETDDTQGLAYGAGVLAGSLGTSYPTEYAVIENCHVTGQVDSKMYAGGLVGSVNYGHISNCTSDTTVTGHTASGGFVGYPFQSSLKNNTAKGSVSSTGHSTGGFAGSANGGCTFANNTTEASATSTAWSTGGFVGYDENSSFIKCTASGNVKAGDWNLGGFAGYLFGSTIETCAAYGDVTGTLATENPKAGGFVGTSEKGSIVNSHATGKVTGSNQYGSAGGFVAYNVSGTTAGCSFDKTKNPDLEGIGTVKSEGSTAITPKNSEEVLADICIDCFGGHSYQENWTIDQAATCQEAGSKSHHCERCNDKKDVTQIEKISHSDIALVKTASKAATHLADGNIDYWYCNSCGKYFSDAAGTKEISLKDTLIPKLTKHTPDNTGWHSDDADHWQTCECGAQLNKTAHTKKTTVTKKATFKKSGNSVTKCTTCEKTFATTKTPKVSKVTLSKTAYIYDGKSKKPSVTVKDSNGTLLKKGKDYSISYAKGRKNVGKYTVKITLKGNKYSGTKTCTFEIKPKNTRLTSESGQKKAFTVKWKKQTKQTNGYQIQYATKKNFSKAKTVTIKKNSTTKDKIKNCAANKKYYVRIRTYKNVKVNGKNTKIVSSWSKYETVKTKK